MSTLALLRTRRLLSVYLLGIAFVAGVLAIALHSRSKLTIVVASSPGGIAISTLALIATVGPLILASVVGPRLAFETPSLAFAFTKPASRTAVAIRYIFADIVGLAVAAVVTLCMLVVIVASLGLASRLRIDDQVLGALLLMFTSATAWYGVVAVASARVDARRGATIGTLSWPLFLAVAVLANTSIPGPIRSSLLALNLLNPIAYLSGTGLSAISGDLTPYLIRAASLFLLTVITISAATALWVARDVSA